MEMLILRHAWLNLWDKHMTTGRINQVSEIQAPSRNCWEPGKIANDEIHKLAHPNFRPNTKNSASDALPQFSSHGLSRALPFTRDWDAATNVLPFIANAMRNQISSKVQIQTPRLVASPKRGESEAAPWNPASCSQKWKLQKRDCSRLFQYEDLRWKNAPNFASRNSQFFFTFFRRFTIRWWPNCHVTELRQHREGHPDKISPKRRRIFARR